MSAEVDELRRALRDMRHLYEQMIRGHVRPDPAQVRSAADGLLAPAIRRVEQVVGSLEHAAARRPAAATAPAPTSCRLCGDLAGVVDLVDCGVRCPGCGAARPCRPG